MNANRTRPSAVKTILCLANSRKLSGRCIAGRELLNGEPGPWIRPVSNREHQEVSEQERQYEDGSDPKLLDLIGVPLMHAQPHQFQRENWLLDPGFYWYKEKRLNWTDLQLFVEPNGPLWINNQSSYNGINDRIAISQANDLTSSLRLIYVQGLTIRVFRPGEAFNNLKRRVRGQFVHNSIQHWLWITDPVYERRYLQQADGEYEVGQCYLTISLGEPHEGFAYKLIAAIIQRADADP